MKALANRLAMQHLVNAYAQETGKGTLLEKYQQDSIQLTLSHGSTLLVVELNSIQSQLLIPLSYVSLVGRHRIAQLPQVLSQGQLRDFSPISIVTLLLEDLVQASKITLDATSLIQRWAESRDALQYFLSCRESDFNHLIAAEQNFLDTEQALILGHSMHPAPKSRLGFVHEDWNSYCPEAKGKTQLHYWLISPEFIAEGSALNQAISLQLKQQILPHLNNSEHIRLKQYPDYKLLPLHPWQARYLQTKPWFKELKIKRKLFDLGETAWFLSPTTSVRTLASFTAPWMFKPSLSVMITNSLRVNLAKECYRGEMSHRLWHSKFGQQILQHCPSLKALNDPAWIALNINDHMMNETICIFRDQPFQPAQQVSCIASLCQDHPTQALNRFNSLFAMIKNNALQTDEHDIALSWFKEFLAVSLPPLMYLYHEHGMAFESHQQNVLIELEQGMPKYLWLRDNQGFYYIEELATQVLAQFPALSEQAQAVGSQAFVDEKFSYYFFGNTLFGIINAIGATGFIQEQELLHILQDELCALLQQYPQSSLLKGLLHSPSLPYKGNLLTRLCELDELMAPLEAQSVYVALPNPLCILQKDARYA